MASASTTLRISITLRCSTNDHHLLVGQPRNRNNLVLPLHSSSSRPSSSVLTFSRRRSNSANSAIISSKKKKKSSPKKDTEEDGDIDEDAFEALFQLLEEDLKNDDLSLNDDDISEEDLAKLERELEEALNDDELLGEIASIANEKIESEDEDEVVVAHDDNVDDKDEELPVKSWQLKKLGYALRKGRRKTNIKNLAAELCLDRAVVLELLRNPPPNLLLLSDALPDEPVPRMIEPESKPQETVPIEISDVARPEAKAETLVHVMQSSWSAQKRIKKVQLETLEQVYRRSKWPTAPDDYLEVVGSQGSSLLLCEFDVVSLQLRMNAMISSIVHVTNLPRKRVLKWFEDRRSEEGVPDHRRPYEPSSKS